MELEKSWNPAGVEVPRFAPLVSFMVPPQLGVSSPHPSLCLEAGERFDWEGLVLLSQSEGIME